MTEIWESIQITKMEAAARQIDAAVRMTLDSEDPVAIATVAGAANRVIRDLCEARGNVESYLRFTDRIKPGYDKQFWGEMNATANFLKHADRDKDGTHKFKVDAASYVLFITIQWFLDLGGRRSPEMKIFLLWWAFDHPIMMKKEFWEELEAKNPGFLNDFGVGHTKLGRDAMNLIGKRALEGEKERAKMIMSVGERLRAYQAFRHRNGI